MERTARYINAICQNATKLTTRSRKTPTLETPEFSSAHSQKPLLLVFHTEGEYCFPVLISYAEVTLANHIHTDDAQLLFTQASMSSNMMVFKIVDIRNLNINDEFF